MSPRPPSASVAARHGWVQALAAVLAALIAMGVVAALGLWAAGAGDLPDGAFPRVVAATVVTAVGGTIELSGNAGALAESAAGLTVIPLSVTLTGALVLAAAFLRPLRHRAVAGAPELAGWAARVAALWLLALLGLAFGARQTFSLSLGEGTISDLGDLFGVSPKVGFRTDVPLTLVFGLLWLAGVLVLALLVSRGAPLPGRLLRFQESVRPAAYAMVVLLLAFVALGVVIALVVMVTRGHAAETFAVILLGMPNLTWLALTLGLGATWTGRVQGPFGLPMPHVLDEVLRTKDVSTLNLRTLAEHDGRVWWLLAVDAVLLLAAAFVMAARSPARTKAWQHALHMAVALVLTVLMICLVGRISAHYGLSVLGIGDLGGDLGGDLSLQPKVWTALGFAVLWGLVTGFLGALLARPVRRRGATEEKGEA
ncbi:streptophobe family protein [Streptomyces sp. NBC_00201]|uniref:streptophobe family protein n=1 Tax=unclassified Streptomyces TaxID=2593676 RepID=UPI002253494C|nr:MULTISPECIES: streptophobe family protein [unclassified Streptomyces]MCX5059805.1 streptophobe family protein [Streptomyces sp. NBC_00452]MCX5252414.1 streptophobe family protein [Streptomyces sp. NBC_00201]MCX5290717.1 streptophobe family protein [Streptomyces sp. NBC_00183]